MTDRKAELSANLDKVRAQIAQLADAASRPAPQLLPVTKFHPAEDVALLAELGITDVAENREQEARAKHEALGTVRFHMIGQIQTKKDNHVARWAASVHSLDSLKLAAALDRGMGNALAAGERAGLPDTLPVFIQVSADGDERRGGTQLSDPEGIGTLVAAVEESEHLELAGFMVVPPLDADAGEVFRAVRALTNEWSATLGRELKLSAGMSADLKDAISAGTDIVRVGTGIMGPRPII